MADAQVAAAQADERTAGAVANPQAVTQVYEGEKKFDLVVRWAEPYRKDLRALRQILVPAPYAPVKFSVRGRDLGSTIDEAQRRAAEVKLPWDTHLEWAGEADQMREAAARLALMTASVALIGLLPAALSRGIGSETQKPLAIVVIGGMLVLALLPRLLLPPLLVLTHRARAVPAHAAQPSV